MKNGRKFSSTMTGAILALAAAVSFLLTGIAFLWFGFGQIAIAPLLIGAVFAVDAVCQFKKSAEKDRDAAEESVTTNGSTLWRVKQMKKGICPVCGAALKVVNGPGMVYCANCGRTL